MRGDWVVDETEASWMSNDGDEQLDVYEYEDANGGTKYGWQLTVSRQDAEDDNYKSVAEAIEAAEKGLDAYRGRPYPGWERPQAGN